MRCDVRPGRAWAVATEAAVAIFGPETPVSTLSAAHALLQAARGGNSIAASLERLGTPFVAVVEDSHGARVVRWRDVPIVADGQALPIAPELVGTQQVVHATSIELGNCQELRQGTLPLANGVAGVSAVRLTLAGQRTEIPGIVARAVDISLDDDTDEISVFDVAQALETRRSSDAYSDELGLLMPGGEFLPLERGAILGRRPHSRGLDGGLPPRLVAVGNDSTRVSRNHVAVRWSDGQLVAEDLDSTNGTSIARAGRVTQRLLPWHPTHVSIGDSLVLGDRLTVTIGATAHQSA